MEPLKIANKPSVEDTGILPHKGVGYTDRAIIGRVVRVPLLEYRRYKATVVLWRNRT